MSSPDPCHRPPVKERLKKLLLIDRQNQPFTCNEQVCRKSIRCFSDVYGSIKSFLCAVFDHHHHHRYTGDGYRA